MKLARSLVLFSLFFAFALPRLSFAQDTVVAQLENQLVAAWLVTVTGEDRTRTLRITGARPNGDGAYQLDAVYGWTDGRQTPVQAEVVATAEERILRITTQPGSKIATKQNPDGTFVGTFTPVNGRSKEIVLTRASDDMLAKAKQAMALTIVQPAANVPAACAAFIGGWKGAWRNYTTATDGDPRWLWVTEVDEKCVAKYAYRYSPGAPSTFQSAEIKDGQLTAACTNGTCTFTSRGGDLWVNYNGSDGSNATVFRKVAN